MPEKATNSFESQYKKFETAASKAVVSRAVILRNLTSLETVGTEQSGTHSLSVDKFAESMHFAYDFVLESNENGSVKPPLTEKQQQELVTKRAIYNAFLPKDSGEEKAPAQPTPVEEIDTAKQKS
ncbi:MAG: hypothetical protein WAW80_04505 [Candidatus Saccharimonadales bacterium]